MASTNHSAFSHNGQFIAFCGVDGKLKIYETATSRLKQEFVPNLHLSSPCSVLEWIVVGAHTNSEIPWKKRKRKSISEDAEQKEIIAMGSTNGTITLYDVSTSSVHDQLLNGHSSTITAITWSAYAGLFTAADDKQIVEWDLQQKAVKCKWKSGKGKVTSLIVLPEGKSLLSGERTIKWWDLETKQVIGTFTGHASQVNILRCAKITNETSYLFSSGSGDDYLSVWSLNEAKKDKISVATLTLPDEVLSFSVKATKDSQILILSITRSGHAQLFKYQANGISSKPIKPALNIIVAADAGPKESVKLIPIISAEITDDSKMILAYGSFLGLSIEKVIPDFSDKVQCLVRAEFRKSKEKKEESVTKLKKTDIEEKVEYLAPGAEAGNVATKRTKSGTQLPLKDRLENLSLNADTNAPDKSSCKGEHMCQLLLQGLQSGDKTLLANVLYVRKESVVKNTLAKLPTTAIIPLLKELTTMVEGKTYTSKFAVLWIKGLVNTHAASMIANSSIREALVPILSLIKAKQALLSDISKLKGRVRLVTGQLSQRAEKQEKDLTDECLLVYQDEDSSEEDIDAAKELDSESDDNWEETSDQEPIQDNIENIKSDDNSSICSSN